VILALSLSLMLLLASGCSKKSFSYEEKDQCGVVPGGYISTIKDADSCRQKCFSGCLSRQMELLGSDFLLSGDAPCNKCTCLCRQ
jgi:hypothetical protein